jgi:type I restriction enzyme S subunit
MFGGLPGTWLFASYLIRVRVVTADILQEFALHYLNSGSARKQLRCRIRTSAGNYNVSASGLKSVNVPVPSPEEQRLIVDGLASAEQRIRNETVLLGGLLNLKSSTADALLSGRIRVPCARGVIT